MNKYNIPMASDITRFVTSLTRRVSLVEQEMHTLPEHLSSPPIFSGVRVARSLVFLVVFYRSLFVLLCFSTWPLGCLSFLELRILITPSLVSLNSSYSVICDILISRLKSKINASRSILIIIM